MKTIATACLVLAALWAVNSYAQSQTAYPQTSASTAQSALQADELYHVHFVKAAPGKINEMAQGYLAAPAGEENAPAPIVLRHIQGDDWDLAVLTPLGKDETLSAAPMSAEQQQWSNRMRGLRAQHSDTFTLGPPWAEVQRKLLGQTAPAAASAGTGSTGTAGTSGQATDKGIYTLTVYRSLPGHRDQLAAVLSKIAALDADTTVALQHMEGAPWEFVMIQRHDSWSALGEDPPMDRLKSQGFNSADALSLELRLHLAEHRDTIARRVTGPSQ